MPAPQGQGRVENPVAIPNQHYFRLSYRVDPEQARTDSRWLYLMAWKAASAKKAVRARRWDYHTCDAGKALISENYRSYMCATPASPAQNTDIRLSLAVTAGTHFIVR